VGWNLSPRAAGTSAATGRTTAAGGASYATSSSTIGLEVKPWQSGASCGWDDIEHRGRVGDISIYGQESNYTTWRLANMNLAIRGIGANIAQGDSFHADA
jgi:hypothetical protein